MKTEECFLFSGLQIDNSLPVTPETTVNIHYC